MNLLRSICCLFGSRCTPEQTRSTETLRVVNHLVPLTWAKRKRN